MRDIIVDHKKIDVILTCPECGNYPMVLGYKEKTIYTDPRKNAIPSYVIFAALYGDIECLKPPEGYPGRTSVDTEVGHVINKVILRKDHIYISSSLPYTKDPLPKHREVIYAELDKQVDKIIDGFIAPWKKQPKQN